LARKSTTHNIDGRELRGINLANVAVDGDIWESLTQNGL
jgi:hypothetical protein